MFFVIYLLTAQLDLIYYLFTLKLETARQPQARSSSPVR